VRVMRNESGSRAALAQPPSSLTPYRSYLPGIQNFQACARMPSSSVAIYGDTGEILVWVSGKRGTGRHARVRPRKVHPTVHSLRPSTGIATATAQYRRIVGRPQQPNWAGALSLWRDRLQIPLVRVVKVYNAAVEAVLQMAPRVGRRWRRGPLLFAQAAPSRRKTG